MALDRRTIVPYAVIIAWRRVVLALFYKGDGILLGWSIEEAVHQLVDKRFSNRSPISLEFGLPHLWGCDATALVAFLEEGQIFTVSLFLQLIHGYKAQ